MKLKVTCPALMYLDSKGVYRRAALGDIIEPKEPESLAGLTEVVSAGGSPEPKVKRDLKIEDEDA